MMDDGDTKGESAHDAAELDVFSWHYAHTTPSQQAALSVYC